jgi:uncharacterized protein YwbE
MSATLEIRGLQELKAALMNLPEYLGHQAAPMVVQHGREAQMAIVAQYPEVTGNLKRGVKMTVLTSGPHGASVRVASTAPHAWLYEHGRCRWGAVSDPPAFVLIPTMERTRRGLYTQLAALMRNAGLGVTEGI